MKKPYHIVSREAETAAASMEEFAKTNGQILLPLVELITNAQAMTAMASAARLDRSESIRAPP